MTTITARQAGNATKTVGWLLIAVALYLQVGEVWAPLLTIGFGLATMVEFSEDDDE